nr:MmcQ/YjbR family DNA-binding protein [Bradyrhizobium sp. CW9]
MTPKTFETRCLRLPAVTKVVQWEGTSVFKVGGKMFALGGGFAARSGGYMFKVSNMAYAMLIEHGLARPAPYLARAKWVQLVGNNALPDAELTLSGAGARADRGETHAEIPQGPGPGLKRSSLVKRKRALIDFDDMSD